MNVKTLVSRRGDKLECVLCGSRGKLTVDHIVPKSRISSVERKKKFENGDLSNYMILCLNCNYIKAHYSLDEFLTQIKKILKHYNATTNLPNLQT